MMSDTTMTEIIFSMTKDLVEIPSSTSDIASNEACIKYVVDFMADTEWKCKEMRKMAGGPPLLYIYPPHNTTNHTSVLLLIHLDVVPSVAYELTGSPDGKIFGRGVSDMKGPSAVLLYLLKHKLDPKFHNVAMLVVSDEETGGTDCAKWAFADVDGPQITCDICHCPDGGDGFKVVTHEKGVLRISLTVEGTNAHSAYPWNGVNAIDLLMNDILALKTVQHEDTNVFNNDELYWHTTLNTSRIVGGEAINQVPRYANAEIDIRYTEQWNISSLKEIINSTVKHAKVDYFFEQGMLSCPPELSYSKDTVSYLEELLGRKIEYSRGHGTSDGHWAEFPTVMFKPVGGGLHQADEWLDFPSLIQYKTAITRLVNRWSSKL
eukprot:CFRG7315T1